jgi:hypothetical protein
MSLNFDSLRARRQGQRLQRKSALGAWVVVGLAVLACTSLLMAGSAAETGPVSARALNPTHNSQCAASSRLAADLRCPRTEHPDEPETPLNSPD